MNPKEAPAESFSKQLTPAEIEDRLNRVLADAYNSGMRIESVYAEWGEMTTGSYLVAVRVTAQLG